MDKNTHLLCPVCRFQCKSHCSYLTHTANAHPTRCDDTSIGRLGNAILYQRTAKLFHCNICFYTAKDFPKLYDHLVVNHCFSGRGEGDGEVGEEGCERRASVDECVNSTPNDVDKGSGDGRDSLDGGENPVPGEKEAESKADEEEEEEEDEEEGGGDNSQVPPTKPAPLNKAKTEREECCPVKRKRGSAAGSEEDEDENDDEDEDLRQTSSGGGKQAEEEVLSKYIKRIGAAGRFQCRLCGRLTRQKGFLVHHVAAKHNVPKPFVCKVCGKAFLLESIMQNHVSLQHKRGIYLCPFCRFSSDLLRGMRRHFNRCNARSEEGGKGKGSDADE